MKKQRISIFCGLLALLFLTGAARASGFDVGETPPGVTAEPVSLPTDSGTPRDAVRVTVPFTVRGRHYLLRLLNADGDILWIGQQEGGGSLSFDVSFDPSFDASLDGEAGGETVYVLVLTTDAPGAEPVSIPLTCSPEVPTDGEESCPRGDTCPLSRYSDLDPAAWYHDGIHAMLEEGIMNGFGDGTFRPDEGTSRAMLVTMLWRMSGEPKEQYALRFSDVKDGAWYAEAVRWAASSGIVGGYDARTFGPDDPVTREQLAAILYRASAAGGKLPDGKSGSLSEFGDADAVSPWAADAVRWAVGCGLLRGSGGMLLPSRPASRAEAAAVLERYGRM